MEIALSISAFGVAIIVGMLLGYLCFARGKDQEIKNLTEQLATETVRANSSESNQSQMVDQVSNILVSLGTIGERMKESESVKPEELLEDLSNAVETASLDPRTMLLEDSASNNDALDEEEQTLTLDEMADIKEEKEEINSETSQEAESKEQEAEDQSETTTSTDEEVKAESEVENQKNEEGKK